MTGIEILTSTEVAIAWEFNWTVFWIVGSVVFIAVTMIGIWEWLGDYCKFLIVPCFMSLGLLGSIIIGGMFGSYFQKPVEYTMEHKVIISDEVSLNEFNEKYKIIGQEGKIYIVRERVDGGKE